MEAPPCGVHRECSLETTDRSAVWSYGFSSTSSGDMYSGVPLIEVSTKVDTLMALANLYRECNNHTPYRDKPNQTFQIPIAIPKVTEFHYTTFPQENILWLHVTMKNAMGM